MAKKIALKPPTPSTTTHTSGKVSPTSPVSPLSPASKGKSSSLFTTLFIDLPALGPALSSAYTSSGPQGTPVVVRLIDAYLAFTLLSGILAFVYCAVVVRATYPYNSFLAEFLGHVGSFVLAVNLRFQVDPKTACETGIAPERAFADFVFANLVLYALVVNYLG